MFNNLRPLVYLCADQFVFVLFHILTRLFLFVIFNRIVTDTSKKRDRRIIDTVPIIHFHSDDPARILQRKVDVSLTVGSNERMGVDERGKFRHRKICAARLVERLVQRLIIEQRITGVRIVAFVRMRISAGTLFIGEIHHFKRTRRRR